MTAIAQPLIDYLRQLEGRGQSHVHIDDEARDLLRQFYRRAQGLPLASQAPVARVADAADAAEVVKAAPASTDVAAAEVPALGLKQGPVVEGATAAERVDSLKRQAAEWAPARALGSFRQTLVFCTGNPEAEMMLVGEAPGYDEERLLEPFAGRAGQKLDAILKAMGTEREQVYISNIVKFRPSMSNQTTNNRKASQSELDAWLPFIEKEVAVVKPKVIVALGGAAAQALLGVSRTVEQLRGQFHTYQGVPLRATYHPSYILHEGVTPEKRMLWEDMLAVMEHLGMPVSDKQRGFFSQ